VHVKTGIQKKLTHITFIGFISADLVELLRKSTLEMVRVIYHSMLSKTGHLFFVSQETGDIQKVNNTIRNWFAISNFICIDHWFVPCIH